MTDNVKMALINADIGDKANEATWSNLVNTYIEDAERDVTKFKGVCKLAEDAYIIDTVPKDDVQRTASGKIKTTKHLKTTYQQYKSRICTLDSLGVTNLIGMTPSEAVERIKNERASLVSADVDPSDEGKFLFVKLSDKDDEDVLYDGAKTDYVVIINTLSSKGLRSIETILNKEDTVKVNTTIDTAKVGNNNA